jgi:hypothetical protein
MPAELEKMSLGDDITGKTQRSQARFSSLLTAFAERTILVTR